MRTLLSIIVIIGFIGSAYAENPFEPATKAETKPAVQVEVPAPVDLPPAPEPLDDDEQARRAAAENAAKSPAPDLIEIKFPEVQMPREIVIDGERVVIMDFLAKWYTKDRQAVMAAGADLDEHLAYHGITECDFGELDVTTKNMLHSACHERDRMMGIRRPPVVEKGVAKTAASAPRAAAGNCPDGRCNLPQAGYSIKLNARQEKRVAKGKRTR